jgi:hypothetical protein
MGGAGPATTPTVPHIFCPGDYSALFMCAIHRVHIFIRDETGLGYLPTLLERTLQLPGDSKCSERGWACIPHPSQPGLILPS